MTPNPGSTTARHHGCTCPVHHNHHGRETTTAGLWWVRPSCSMHGVEATMQEPDTEDCE